MSETQATRKLCKDCPGWVFLQRENDLAAQWRCKHEKEHEKKEEKLDKRLDKIDSRFGEFGKSLNRWLLGILSTLLAGLILLGIDVYIRTRGP